MLWASSVGFLCLFLHSTAATCATGVWDEYASDLSDATTEIPFEPQLVLSGAGASGLSFTGVSDESLLILKVRVSAWFQEADVTLSTYDFCSDTYATTYDSAHAEMIEGCDTSYKIYQIQIPYAADCNFTYDEDPGLTTLSGYLSVAATVDQDFLGRTIERSFEVPVGWYISYDTDFSVSTSTSISQSNECYDGQEASQCSSFPCDASTEVANVCNCDTAYDDPQAAVDAISGATAALHAICTGRSHSHDAPARECSLDTADPAIWCTDDSTIPGAYVIDLYDQSGPLAAATLGSGDYGDGNFVSPYFDDCQVPGDGSLTDLASVSRDISHEGTPVDTTSLTGSYADTSVDSFNFNQVGLWLVEYAIEDDSANTATCSFYVSVVDTAAPTTCSVEGNSYNVRGLTMADFEALAKQTAEYTPGETDTGETWGADTLAHWTGEGYDSLDWRTQLRTVFQTVCIDEAATYDAQGNTHCSDLTLDAALTMDASGVTDWADSSAVTASAFFDQLATVHTPKCQSDLYSAYKSGGAGDIDSTCLHEGTFTMVFTVEDESGNTNPCSIDLVVANTPPDLDCGGVPKYINQFQAGRYGLSNGTYKGETGQLIVGIDSFGHELLVDVSSGYRTADLAGSASLDFVAEVGSVAIDTQLFKAVLLNESGGAATVIATTPAALSAYVGSLALPHENAGEIASSWRSPLFVYWAAFDAVGNTRVCTVAYTPRDVTIPTTSCKTTRALELPATSRARLVRLGDLLDIAPVTDDVYSTADFFKVTAGPTAPYLFDINQAISYCVITCATPPCTSAGQDPEETFSGIDASRRRLAQYDGADATPTGTSGKYDTTCEDVLYFDADLNVSSQGTFLLDADWPADFGISVGEGPGDSADPMDLTAGIFFAYAGTMDLEISIADLLDDVATDASANTGTAYYYTYAAPADQTQMCSNTLTIVDVTDPVIGSCPSGTHTHVLGQHDFSGPSGTFEAGYYLDAMVDETNYKTILASLTDNSQLTVSGTETVLGVNTHTLLNAWSQNHHQLVFIDPSYTTADAAAGIQTGSTYSRNALGAEQTLTYTAYDASGNAATCTVELDVQDTQSPDQDCPFAHSSAQTYAMDAGEATAVVQYVYTTYEGQSTDPSTEWTITPSLGTVSCVASGTDYEFTCTQDYTLTTPETNVWITTTIEDEDTRVAADECSWQHMLIDTEDPVVTLCTGNIDVAFGYDAINTAWTNGDISALHTATDNWGLHQTTPWTYSPDITDGSYQWFLGATTGDAETNANHGVGQLTVTATVSDRATAASGGPNTATCQFTITPVTSCGDGFMDLNGEHGTAEECEPAPHPDSAGCLGTCLCDTASGWTADAEGGCTLECATGEPAGEDCDMPAAYMPTDCPAGGTLLPYVGVGSTGTAAWLKPLEPDCTPGDYNTWGTACQDFYTSPSGLGYPHYQGPTLTPGAGYYNWDDSPNTFMDTDLAGLIALLINPYEAIAFEWWLAGGVNTPANAADEDDVHLFKVCNCSFFEDAVPTAFVLDGAGEMVPSTEQCAGIPLTDDSGDPFEVTYDATTECFEFPLCRTGPVIVGSPKGATDPQIVTCLDESDLTTNNEVTQDNYASVAWTFEDRVQLFPGVLKADVVMTTVGTPPALGSPVGLGTEGGDFYADPAENTLYVVATAHYNGTTDACSWRVLVQDVVEPVVDCTGFAITLTEAISEDDFSCTGTTCTFNSGNIERAGVDIVSYPTATDETQLATSGDCDGPLYSYVATYDFTSSSEIWEPTRATGLCGLPTGAGCSACVTTSHSVPDPDSATSRITYLDRWVNYAPSDLSATEYDGRHDHFSDLHFDWQVLIGGVLEDDTAGDGRVLLNINDRPAGLIYYRVDPSDDTQWQLLGRRRDTADTLAATFSFLGAVTTDPATVTTHGGLFHDYGSSGARDTAYVAAQAAGFDTVDGCEPIAAGNRVVFEGYATAGDCTASLYFNHLTEGDLQAFVSVLNFDFQVLACSATVDEVTSASNSAITLTVPAANDESMWYKDNEDGTFTLLAREETSGQWVTYTDIATSPADAACVDATVVHSYADAPDMTANTFDVGDDSTTTLDDIDCGGACVGPFETENGIPSIWGSVVVTVTAVDAAGNAADAPCDVTYHFDDATDPVIVCPATQNVDYNAGEPDYTGTVDIPYTVTDNSGFTVGQEILGNSFVVADTWTTASYTDQTADSVVTITHQDYFGNEGSCDTTLVFVDTEGPAFSCLAAPSLSRNEVDLDCAHSSGICVDLGKSNGVFYTVSDNKDVLGDITVSVEVNFGNGTTSTLTNPVIHLASTWLPTWQISVTATDTSGNSEQAACDFNITFADTQDPVLTCPNGGSTVTLSLSDVSAGEAAAPDSFDYVSSPATQSFITLDAASVACLPGGGTDPTTSWCPSYVDAYGGLLTGGDSLVATPASALTVETTVAVTYTVDDSKGNTGSVVCNIAIVDDIDPTYDTECGTYDSTTRTLLSSALLVPATTGDPDSSQWDWANTDLDHVFTNLGWQVPTAGWYESTGSSSPWLVMSGDTDMTAVDLAPIITVPQASVSFSVTGTDSGSNAATCAYSVGIDDDVPPEVMSCNSVTAVTYNMSDCCETDYCASCPVTLSVEVSEDIRLEGVCTDYDVDGAGCNGATANINGPIVQTMTEDHVVAFDASPVVVAWDQTGIADWDSNAITGHGSCSMTVTMIDDQAPLPVHSCLDQTEGAAQARDTKARIHNGGASLIVPTAIWPEPEASDVQGQTCEITLSVDGGAASTIYDETILAGGSFPALDPSLDDLRVRGVGEYDLVYTYTDSDANTYSCAYYLEVLESYNPGSSDPLLVSFYVSNGQNQTARRRAMSQINDGAQFQSFTGTISWLVAQPYPMENSLTAINSGTTTFDTDAPVQLTSEGLNCLSAPGNTKVAAPPELISGVPEADRRCFEKWQLSFSLDNCSALMGLVALDHTAECKPAGDANDYGYLWYGPGDTPDTLDATFAELATPKCTETWPIETVSVVLRAFEMCKNSVGAVSLTERFLVGSRAWATAVVQGAEVGANGQYDVSGITPFGGSFAVSGETSAETVEICVVFGAIPATSGAVQDTGGAEVDSVSLSALTVSAYSDIGQTTLVSGPTDELPGGSLIAGTSSRATLAAACWDQAVPARAEDGVDGLLSLSIVADGTVAYRLDQAGNGRRRLSDWEEEVLTKTYETKLKQSTPLPHEDAEHDSALVRMLRRDVKQETEAQREAGYEKHGDRRVLAQAGGVFAAPVQDTAVVNFPLTYGSAAAPSATHDLGRIMLIGGLAIGGVCVLALACCLSAWGFARLTRKHKPLPQMDMHGRAILAPQMMMTPTQQMPMTGYHPQQMPMSMHPAMAGGGAVPMTTGAYGQPVMMVPMQQQPLWAPQRPTSSSASQLSESDHHPPTPPASPNAEMLAAMVSAMEVAKAMAKADGEDSRVETEPGVEGESEDLNAEGAALAAQ